MKKEDKDIICDLWLQVFGVQEGIGRNCPNGAYEFAALILEEAAKCCEEMIASVIDKPMPLKDIVTAIRGMK